jgi:hypothetical protein
MARDFLAAVAGHRHRFRATIGRTGEDGKGRRTLLLTEVIWQEAALVSDHLWVGLTEVLHPACGHVGERVAFTALVREYRRIDATLDCGLGAIEDVRLLGGRR